MEPKQHQEIMLFLTLQFLVYHIFPSLGKMHLSAFFQIEQNQKNIFPSTFTSNGHFHDYIL